MMQRIKKMGFECSNYIVDLAERLVSSKRIESAILLLEAAVESGNDTREIRGLLDSLLIAGKGRGEGHRGEQGVTGTDPPEKLYQTAQGLNTGGAIIPNRSKA